MTCTEVRGSEGFVLDEGTPVYFAGGASSLRDSFQEYFLCFFGFELWEVSTRVPARMEIVEHSEGLPPEGYMLEVPEKARGVLTIGVAAATLRSSMLHALQSLRQLLPPTAFRSSAKQDLPWRVPPCRIRDSPRYSWRGLMLDVARHFFGVSEVKQLLLIMSMHKLNVLHLHLTDDQGWRIEVASKPELALVGGQRNTSINRPQGDWAGERIYNGTPYATPRFFKRKEVQELVAFARVLEIEVVPEIDVPAHAAALIIAARSKNKDLGTVQLHEGCDERQGGEPLTAPPNCMGGTHGILLPTRGAMDYVLSALEEIVPLFPGRYFHLGGDEADEFRDQAYTSDIAEQLKQNLSIISSTQLQGYMVNEVHKLLTRHGKTAIAWDETHFGLEDYSPPKDVLAMWWRDWSSEAGWEMVRELGPRLILAPQGKMYMDSYQMEPHSSSRHRVQEGTVSLWHTYSAAQLEASGIMGVHGCLWSEHLNSSEVLEYQLFPRGAAVAEVGWTPKARAQDFKDFLHRWSVHAERLAAMGMEFYDGNYTGEPDNTSLPAGEPHSEVVYVEWG